MRTTVRLDDQLLADAKRFALSTGRTLTRVIEDALREALARGKRSTRSRRARSVRLKTYGKGGLRPGVDLDDSAALRDLMDGG